MEWLFCFKYEFSRASFTLLTSNSPSAPPFPRFDKFQKLSIDLQKASRKPVVNECQCQIANLTISYFTVGDHYHNESVEAFNGKKKKQYLLFVFCLKGTL